MKFEWWFWDTNKELLNELFSLKNKYNYEQIKICEDIKSLEEKFNVVILANLLHELNPINASNVFVQVRNFVKDGIGKILILEMYPLIHPEKLAVPYDRKDLENILLNIGWQISSDFWSIKGGGVQAYYICGHSPDDHHSTDYEKILSVITNKWDEILSYNCSLYKGISEIASAKEQVGLLSILTTIASINNYRH